MSQTGLQQTPKSWNTALQSFMLVLLPSFVLGSKDSHISTERRSITGPYQELAVPELSATAGDIQ